MREKREVCIYLAGPMTGFEDYNYQRFVETAARLKESTGCHIVHTANIPRNRTWDQYMEDSIRHMLMCDLVIVMTGSENSKGAQVEIETARKAAIPVLFERLGKSKLELNDNDVWFSHAQLKALTLQSIDEKEKLSCPEFVGQIT